MSVTFQCSDAPRRQVPCLYCAEPWADYPEGNGRGGRCDRFCTGFEEESEAPEVNFANGNAQAVLALLGWTDPEAYLGGEVDGGTLRQRIFRARNRDLSAARREALYLPAGHAGAAVVRDADGQARIERRGAAVIVQGNTDERTLDRLSALEDLAIYAQEHGFQITWG